MVIRPRAAAAIEWLRANNGWVRPNHDNDKLFRVFDGLGYFYADTDELVDHVAFLQGLKGRD